MALHSASPPAPSAEVVGNAFVEQYYHILHQSPELVHRFYQDSSVLSRPDPDGVMKSVTTMQGINDKILSLNFKEYKAEIKTADAQKSHKEGVTVLVTGCLIGKDNLRRKFAQSFFLAPQDNGYFVLNDIFRFVEDTEPLETHSVNRVNEVPITSETEHVNVTNTPPDPINSHVVEDQNVVENAYDSSDHVRQLTNENEPVVEIHSHPNGSEASETPELSSSSLENAPKKSYASIVKVPKGSSGPTRVYVPTNNVKVAPQITENLSVEEADSALPEASSVNVEIPERNDTHEEVKGYSIYIRNLPLHVTVAQLEAEFKKFGPIKQDGIQVRNNKQQGYCFGFVEFESWSSMNKALQASPINIGGRHAVVEIKRTTTRVGSSNTGRGRFLSGRGGYRADNFRPRGAGNYGGGAIRGYVRQEYGIRGEFSGRGRVPTGRGGDINQQGRGRGIRPSAPNLAPVALPD